MQKYYVTVTTKSVAGMSSATRWYSDPECTIRHRIDGPAIEYTDGDGSWWLNGKRHREDGPASVVCGVKEWYVNGKQHREDGPAIEWADGSKYWFLDGKMMTKAEHARLTAPVQEMTVAEIEARLGYKIKVVK